MLKTIIPNSNQDLFVGYELDQLLTDDSCLDKFMMDISNYMEKSAEQGYGYKYKSYTCEDGYTHDEQIDGSASLEYRQLDDLYEQLLDLQKTAQKTQELMNKFYV